MKNRKLFAILTLVAFMMTLLPMAAFAAPGTADRHASIVKVDKTKVEAKADKHAEFTVYVRDNANNPIPNEVVYVASERGTTDTIVSDNATDYPEVASGATNVKAFKANASGKVVFNVSSTVPGDAEIAVGLNNQVYDYLTDSDTTAATAGVIAVKTITFEATDAKDVKLISVTPRGGSAITSFAEDNSEAGDRVYYKSKSGSTFVPFDGIPANGVDYYKIKFALTNESNAPVEGEKIKFSANKNNVSFNVDEDETDEIGEVEVRVYANKAGTYKITAEKGSNQAVVYLTFAPSEVANIELAADVDPKVAIDEEKPSSFKLKFTDALGNKIDPRTVAWGALNDCELTFEWIVEPKDSDLDDEWAMDPDDGTIKDDFISFTNDNLMKVYLPDLDEEGDYVLRVNLENGKYVDVKFEAKEQGDITKLSIKYDNANLELGAVSDTPTVKRYDADGVSVEVNNTSSDLRYSINDYRALYKDSLVDRRDLDALNGVVYATDDDDYVGEYVVTVIDSKYDLTASTTIRIGNAVTGLDLEVPATLPVGKENTVKLSLIDADGHVTGLGNDASVEFDVYVVSQPTGAYASAEATDSDAKLETDLKEKGYAYVDLYSKVEGDVTFTFVVKSTKDATSVNYTKTVTVTFAEAKAPVVYGAKNVTMFIGSTGFVADGNAGTMDQAPFIQDNRTFVPLRAVATALGATNEDTMWDPATQTITLVRPDLTVTMTIGSNVLTLSDGSTVVADVAPFIVAETGRTVIPFRAIAEAFGADVEAVFAADGTTTAVTFSQE